MVDISQSQEHQPITEIQDDPEGYFPFFEKNQVQEYLEFFKKYGVVVIRVFNREQCNRSIDDLWAAMEKENSKFKRNDPLSWDNFPGNAKFGMFPYNSAFYKFGCENRQNPDVYEVFKNIYADEKLWVSIDRFGVLRPTKNIQLPESEEIIDRPEWKSRVVRLHFDMNPWYYLKHQQTGQVPEVTELDFDLISENNDNYDQPNRVQGLITFDDTPIKNGGFCCVLSFDKRLSQWAEENRVLESKFNSKHFVMIPENDAMYKEIRYIPVRAGCIIVWKNTQLHSNFPNDSSDFRYVQYVKMFPVPIKRTQDEIKRYQLIMKKNLPPNLRLTDLGEKLFRLKPWD